MLTFRETIRPSADLRNHYNEVSRQCRENKEAVIITVNGRGDTVSLSYEEYNRLKARIELLEILAEAEEDVKNGRTSRGYACAEFGVKNTTSTRFTIASVTKQFTAFAVMLLYDRGLLFLDADANTYLPEDMQIPAGITVHDLLAHTSGLYNFYNFEDSFYVGEDRLPYDRKAFLNKWILKQPTNTPGETFNYNNSN